MAYGAKKPRVTFNPFAKQFWLQSAVLHAVALLLVFLFGSYAVSQETARANTLKVAQSIDRTERAQKQKVEKKVADSGERLQKMEARMQKLSGEAEKPEPKLGAQLDTKLDTKLEVEDPKKKLEQALEKARKSLEKIEKLEQKAKAAELAKLLKIPVEEALKRLPPKPPEAVAPVVPLTDKQIVEKVAEYEKQAKKILDGEEQKELKKTDGTPVAQNLADKSANNANNANIKAQKSDAGKSDRSVKTADNKAASGSSRMLSSSAGGLSSSSVSGGTGSGGTLSNATGDGNGSGSGSGSGSGVGEDGVQNKGVGELGRNYDALIATQKIDKQTMRAFDGRIIGAGADFTNRIYLNAWYLIGPFVANKAISEEALPPEAGVDLDAAYFGKVRQLLQWEYVETKSYPFVPPNAEGDAVYYGYTEIMLDKDRVLIADIGSDDDAKIWVNDALVWRGNNSKKPWYYEGGFRPRQADRATYNLTEGSVALKLKKGRNKIMFRLVNGYADTFFSMVLRPVG